MGWGWLHWKFVQQCVNLKTQIFPGYICNMLRSELANQTVNKTSIWSKSTFIKTSWSRPLSCWQLTDASYGMQCISALLWFVQNIIASDYQCFYWIRLTLLMRKEISKQVVLSLAGVVKLLSQFLKWFVLFTHTFLGLPYICTEVLFNT